MKGDSDTVMVREWCTMTIALSGGIRSNLMASEDSFPPHLLILKNKKPVKQSFKPL